MMIHVIWFIIIHTVTKYDIEIQTLTGPAHCSVQNYLARCTEHPQPTDDRSPDRAVDRGCMAGAR